MEMGRKWHLPEGENKPFKMAFKKYPEIPRLGHEDVLEILQYGEDFIFVEAKVDGGNGSMWIDEKDGQVHFGSRNRDLTSDQDYKMFAGLQAKLREHLHIKEMNGIILNPDYFYYFEWMAVHTIRYTSAPFIIGLDIRLKRAMDSDDFGLFLSREGKEREFDRIGIEIVPLVWKGKVSDLKKLKVEELVPQSKYFNGLEEGIVIKNYSRMSKLGHHQLFAKVVREEFKEDNRAVFGSVKNKESDSDKIVNQFVTEARIKKQIHKLVDEEGKTLDRSLMQFLPSAVIKDVVKEEILFIYDTYSYINFKELKGRVPKLCLKVIDEMMTMNAVQ